VVLLIEDKNLFYEKHHIVPKCLGGDNSLENKVNLTPREHFIAHLLLHRIYPDNNKISFAFIMMAFRVDKYGNRQYKVSSRVYQEAREIQRELAREVHTGKIVSEETRAKFRARTHSEESRRKIGLKSKGRARDKKISEEQKKAISIAQTGRIKRPEELRKISEASKRKKWSPELKERMSKILKGVPKKSENISRAATKRFSEKGICPYCGTEGQLMNLKKSHFEKCKSVRVDIAV